MALHPYFPESPYTILDPATRWFPADEALLERRAALCASQPNLDMRSICARCRAEAVVD
jgi:hypothetical protein